MKAGQYRSINYDVFSGKSNIKFSFVVKTPADTNREIAERYDFEDKPEIWQPRAQRLREADSQEKTKFIHGLRRHHFKNIHNQSMRECYTDPKGRMGICRIVTKMPFAAGDKEFWVFFDKSHAKELLYCRDITDSDVRINVGAVLLDTGFTSFIEGKDTKTVNNDCKKRKNSNNDNRAGFRSQGRCSNTQEEYYKSHVQSEQAMWAQEFINV